MSSANSGESKAFLGGLARRLVADGVVAENIASESQQKARKNGGSFVALLLESAKELKPNTVASSAAQEFGAPLVDLSAVTVDPDIAASVSAKLLQKHSALPIYRRGKKLYVAVSDPTNLQALDELKFASGLSTEAIVVEHDKLMKRIDEVVNAAESASMDIGDADLENLEVSDEEEGNEDVGRAGAEEAPVVRFVNKILVDAINGGASDIHFEPYEKMYRIRYRTDGILKEVATPPVQMGGRLAARVKVMSRMDLAERRVPQDGRIKLKLSKSKSIDFRVNTCPTLWGEKIVLRILDPSSASLGIDMLGYESEQKDRYMKALSKPQGMILVTGPTGSGKTVSLYTGLNILNTEDINISTAEDPAEINLPGINQVNVMPKVGLTFAAALKSFLRQDPDVVMVGEIRDLETAEIAIKAAQTGHLVLSTLHTNDAPQTVTRLMNMGVPAYNIASSISLIIAQRLARRLCKSCKKPANIPEKELIAEGFDESEVKELKIFEAVGCDQCNDGYKGRTGIYQVMPISEETGQIIMSGGNAMQIAAQALKEGIADLRMSALKKVRDGQIDLKEANRVTVD